VLVLLVLEPLQVVSFILPHYVWHVFFPTNLWVTPSLCIVAIVFQINFFFVFMFIINFLQIILGTNFVHFLQWMCLATLYTSPVVHKQKPTHLTIRVFCLKWQFPFLVGSFPNNKLVVPTWTTNVQVCEWLWMCFV
jgi:hypothetical protein